MDGFVIEMQLPRRLRDLGIREGQVPELAHLAFADRTVQNNPKPIAMPRSLRLCCERHGEWERKRSA